MEGKKEGEENVYILVVNKSLRAPIGQTFSSWTEVLPYIINHHHHSEEEIATE